MTLQPGWTQLLLPLVLSGDLAFLCLCPAATDTASHGLSLTVSHAEQHHIQQNMQCTTEQRMHHIQCGGIMEKSMRLHNDGNRLCTNAQSLHCKHDLLCAYKACFPE